jgi:hypothetical protein
MGLTGQAARFAPQLFDDTEVWGMNDGMTGYTQIKFDRWFELHGAAYIEQWPSCKRFGGMVAYCKAIDALNIPVHTMDILPVIRDQVMYPHIEIATAFMLNHVDGTPSRMLALACYEHQVLGREVEYIQSFGIDMRDPQHAPQRPAWATWLTVAKSLGIEIGGTAWDFADCPETDGGIAIDRTETARLVREIESAKKESAKCQVTE